MLVKIHDSGEERVGGGAGAAGEEWKNTRKYLENVSLFSGHFRGMPKMSPKA